MDGGIEVILGELIELMRATAPALWAIARRQVFASLVINAAWAGLLLLVATVSWRAALRDIDGDNATFCALVAVIIALFCITKVVEYTINPDYYAIKVLLELVR